MSGVDSDVLSRSIIVDRIKSSIDVSLMNGSKLSNLAFNINGKFPFKSFGGEFSGWTVSFFQFDDEGQVGARFGLVGENGGGQVGCSVVFDGVLDVSDGISESGGAPVVEKGSVDGGFSIRRFLNKFKKNGS